MTPKISQIKEYCPGNDMVYQHLQRIYKATSIICQIRVVPLKWSIKLPFIVHITRQERAAFRNLGIWYCPFSQTTYWTCRFCFFLCILVSQLRFLSPPAAPSPRTFQSSHIFFQLWQRGSCSTGEIILSFLHLGEKQQQQRELEVKRKICKLTMDRKYTTCR